MAEDQNPQVITQDDEDEKQQRVAGPPETDENERPASPAPVAPLQRPAVPAGAPAPEAAPPVIAGPPASVPTPPAVAGPQRPALPEGAVLVGNRAMTPVQAQNPFAVLFAKESNIHNPALRTAAKVGTSILAGMEGLSKEYPAIEAGRVAAAEEPMKEAAERAGIAHTQAETAALGKPKMTEIAGAAGPKGETLFRDENNPAAGPSILGPQGFEPLTPVAGPAAPQPSAPVAGGGAVPPAAGPVTPPAPVAGPRPGVATVKPKEQTQAEQSVKPEDLTAWDTQLPTLTPDLTASQRSAFAFPPGYVPSNKELTDQKAAAEKAQEFARQGKQDQLRDAILTQNSELTRQINQEKIDKNEADRANNADVQYSNLYAQKNYEDKMESWYKSGHFAKDSGLVTAIVNDAHGNTFNAGPGLDAAIGSLFGPTGIAIGAATGLLANAVGPEASGYLASLKKQGISKEGYDAMQAYFNALPGRMSYELGTGGVKAGAMRSSQLINKVMNTVPPPNTPQEDFESSFQQYYKTMETNVKKTQERSAPKGYTPPKYEDYYGGTVAQAGTPTRPANVPANFVWVPEVRQWQLPK